MSGSVGDRLRPLKQFIVVDALLPIINQDVPIEVEKTAYLFVYVERKLSCEDASIGDRQRRIVAEPVVEMPRRIDSNLDSRHVPWNSRE